MRKDLTFGYLRKGVFEGRIVFIRLKIILKKIFKKNKNL